MEVRGWSGSCLRLERDEGPRRWEGGDGCCGDGPTLLYALALSPCPQKTPERLKATWAQDG
jgi:hypothetical protein